MAETHIHIKVDDKLKHKARTKALKERKTLTEVVIDLITKWLRTEV